MTEKKLTGRHVLMMLAGFFGVMIVANIAFVYFALTTFTGLSTENSYNRGLHYNRELQAQSAQDALLWQADVQIFSPAGKEGHVTLNLRDQNGALISDLEIIAHIRNPVDDEGDVDLVLLPGSDGYSASFTLSRAGQWDLRIWASHPSLKTPYRINRRFMSGT